MFTEHIYTERDFVNRLVFLCSQKGVKYKDIKNLPRALAEELVDSEIIPPIGTRKNRVENARQKITRDIENEFPVKAEFLDWYCRYFGCSADFLMGYIDTPTHEEKVLKDLTALSDTSCRALLEKDSIITNALDLLLPDLRRVFAYNPIESEDYKNERELDKYNFFYDIVSYLTSKEAKSVSSGFSGSIETEGVILFSDESGNLAALDPGKISAVLMLEIQEVLQRIRDDIQNKNKAPA